MRIPGDSALAKSTVMAAVHGKAANTESTSNTGNARTPVNHRGGILRYAAASTEEQMMAMPQLVAITTTAKGTSPSLIIHWISTRK